MPPNFIIIGAQKSASTFIHKCLSQHTQVYMPEGEVTFFESPELDENNPDLTALERLFLMAPPNKLMGIKRPNYFGIDAVPSRIHKIIPNAKLIVVLRNPKERAVSAYYHYMYYNFIPIINHEIGLPKLIDAPSFYDDWPRSSEILSFGLYYKHLMNYYRYFEKKQVLVLLHDEVSSSPRTALSVIYKFLDIDDESDKVAVDGRPQSVIYKLQRIWLLRIRNRSLYHYGGNRLEHRINKSMIDYTIIAATTAADTIMKLLLGNKKPILSKELQEKIYSYYAEDISNLEKFLSLDLSRWK